MSVVKGVWASVQGDPVFMRRLNGWLTLFWVAMIPVSYELGWLKSVVYVSALSLWALVCGPLVDLASSQGRGHPAAGDGETGSQPDRGARRREDRSRDRPGASTMTSTPRSDPG